ncbi:MAG: hypothetical protein WC374_08850 [Phycisphaerae bacterium]|jgi:hypothetical protein
MENALVKINFGIEGQTLQDVAMNPDNYPEEIVAAYMDAVNMVNQQLREAKIQLEANILKRMTNDNATKMIFKSIDGCELVATRKKGAVKCEARDADEVMKQHGFQPGMIGDYKFVPSWSKAKEASKLGGDIQVLIDDMFKEQKESITITEK